MDLQCLVEMMASWMSSHSSYICKTLGYCRQNCPQVTRRSTTEPQTWTQNSSQQSSDTVSDMYTSTVYASSVQSICRASIWTGHNPWSKQTDTQTGKALSFPPFMEPGHTGWQCFNISSSSHCWWARSYAANSEAWLACNAGSLLVRNEEFLHMHTWLMNKVWSLPTFFTGALARRKVVLADGPFD